MTQKTKDRINKQYFTCAELKGTLDYIIEDLGPEHPLRDVKLRELRERLGALTKELLEIEFSEKLHTSEGEDGGIIYAV